MSGILRYLANALRALLPFRAASHVSSRANTVAGKKRKSDAVETPKKRRRLEALETPKNTSKKHSMPHISPHAADQYEDDDDWGGFDDAATELQPRFIHSNAAAEHARMQQQLRDQLGMDSDEEEPTAIDVHDVKDMSTTIEQFHIDEDVVSDRYDSTEITTLVTPRRQHLREQTYRRVSPMRRRISELKFSADKLRAEGYDEEHVQFISMIAYRGYQAVLPVSWRRGLIFLPQNLFAPDDEAFISCNNTSSFHAEVVFRRMLDIGPAVRSFIDQGQNPEQQTSKFLREYMKWAIKDSGLDKRTVLPVVRIVTAPSTVDVRDLETHAIRTIKRLHTRYQRVFKANGVSRSIPRLYTLVATHETASLTTLTPDGGLVTQGLFDFDNPDLDFWNALAMAMIICHSRNVQTRIAKDTGIGVKRNGNDRAQGDPDL